MAQEKGTATLSVYCKKGAWVQEAIKVAIAEFEKASGFEPSANQLYGRFIETGLSDTLAGFGIDPATLESVKTTTKK